MLKKIVVGALSLILLVLGGLVALTYLAPEQALDLALRGERRASGLEEVRIEAGGLQWRVLRGGTPAADGLPLVLIHGFGGNGDHWTRTARVLTPAMEVIAPDLVGFGQSAAAPDGRYSIPDQAERLHTLLQAMGISRAHFGANSMGGWIVGTYAAAHPEAVASLWILDSAGLNTTKSEMALAMEQGLKLPLVVRNAAEYDARMRWVFVNPPPIPAPFKNVLMARDIAQADQNEAIRAQLYGVSPWLDTLIPGTAATEIPALIVWGEKDRVLHPDGAKALQALLPKSTVLMMPNVGHCPMLEVPAQAANDYLAWRHRSGG